MGRSSNRQKDDNNRRPISLDNETKAVFNWSMKNKNSKTQGEHLQKLLMSAHNKDDWRELVKSIDPELISCKVHGKHHVMYCYDCKTPFCPSCDIMDCVKKGHEVGNYCREHQTGFRESCLLCDKERWNASDIVEINEDGLKAMLDDYKKVLVVDVRNDKEYGQGHLPDDYHTYHLEFKHINRPDTTILDFNRYIIDNGFQSIVVMSQWLPKNKKQLESKGAGRSFIAAVKIKMIFKDRYLYYLMGGWTAFHLKYPDIVNDNHDPCECKVCQLYRL